MQRPPSSSREDRSSGFLCTGAGDIPWLEAAAPGQRIDCQQAAQRWFVVDHHPMNCLLGGGWPVRLWKVTVASLAPSQPDYPGLHTRASAIEVVEELPLSMLFGPRGDAVVEFLNRIRTLTGRQIRNLSIQRDQAAAKPILENIWIRWMEHPMSNRAGSPIGAAPLLLSNLVTEIAEKAVGNAAFVHDDGESYLGEPWSHVATCLHNALFAIGIEDPALHPSERAILRRAYDKAMADSPDG